MKKIITYNWVATEIEKTLNKEGDFLKGRDYWVEEKPNNKILDEIKKYIDEEIAETEEKREHCEPWEVEKYDAILNAYGNVSSKIRKVT